MRIGHGTVLCKSKALKLNGRYGYGTDTERLGLNRPLRGGCPASASDRGAHRPPPRHGDQVFRARVIYGRRTNVRTSKIASASHVPNTVQTITTARLYMISRGNSNLWTTLHSPAIYVTGGVYHRGSWCFIFLFFYHRRGKKNRLGRKRSWLNNIPTCTVTRAVDADEMRPVDVYFFTITLLFCPNVFSEVSMLIKHTNTQMQTKRSDVIREN
jgi:hypothetical protein